MRGRSSSGGFRFFALVRKSAALLGYLATIINAKAAWCFVMRGIRANLRASLASLDSGTCLIHGLSEGEFLIDLINHILVQLVLLEQVFETRLSSLDVTSHALIALLVCCD